ncbi:DMT family transporter [Caballeronia sp. LZ034LL]|uniref:DMT family transporter n=1 Tax=Caballeronia sp. LZ034LL TaxID=3038567 RepID=UPI00285DA52E|nr:DMT family transporter [Caballeronia sp. LZ034LL]MDR5836229.1 DMT family transporter [Caballeronia sp. LZ034LL]
MRMARLAFVLLGLFWGSNFIYMKWAASSITPMQIAFVRVLFGFLPLAFVAWRTKVIERRQLRHLHHFCVMGVLATAFYYVAITRGTALVPSGMAAMLANAATLFTAIFSALFLRSEKLNSTMTFGVLLGFLGITLIARPWEGAGGAIDLTGVLWLLTSSMVLGLSYVYVRVFLTPLGLPPLALATWQMGIAVLVLAAVTDFNGVSHLLNDPFAAVALVIGGGVLGTGVSFFLYYYLLERFGAVASSAATYLAPAVALVIGWAVGERFGWLELTAFVLVILSVVTLHLGRQRTVQRAAA